MANDKDPKPPKTVTIIINGMPFEEPKGDISFNRVVQLVFPDEQHPDDKYAITYERGENPNKPDGVLSSGNSVKIKEGMVFVVSPTGQS